jgi:hypothetical protein
MRLLILFIVLVVGSVGQNPLMHRHGFPNGVVDKPERRAEANACDVYVGSSGGQFYYFGWQSMADSPTSPTHVDSH